MSLQSGTLELQADEALSLIASCHVSPAERLEPAGEAACCSQRVHACASNQKADMPLQRAGAGASCLSCCGMSWSGGAEIAGFVKE
jgi:hypothetical protein